MSTTFCLRAWVTAMSMDGALVSTPNTPASATVRKTAAVSSSSFAGMHPTFRQVPPTLCISIIATSSPAAAP